MLAALPRVGKVDIGEWTKAFKQVWILAGGDAWRYNEETWGGAQKPKKSAAVWYYKQVPIALQYKQAPAAWLVHVAGYIDSVGGDNITEISATTQDKVKNAIFAGMEREEGMPDIAARISDLYDGFEGYRATMIARSEVVDASNQASMAQAREAGSTLDLMWVATLDDRTREEHAEMDGVTVAYDQEFDCADGTTMPGEAVNCRCAIGYAVPSEPVAEAAAEGIQIEGLHGEFSSDTENSIMALRDDPLLKELGLEPKIVAEAETERRMYWVKGLDYETLYANSKFDRGSYNLAYDVGHEMIKEGTTPDLVSYYAKDLNESMRWNMEHEYFHLWSGKELATTGGGGVSNVFSDDKVLMQLGRNLSTYAAGNENEAAAEAFVAWRHGYADKLPEAVVKFFRLKFGVGFEGTGI